jgi:hypothetical protein
MKVMKMILAAMVLTGCSVVHAQEKQPDTLALLRDFITMSNTYKQPPVYISIQLINSANLVTEAEDTLAIKGEFYIRQEGAYMRFGEFEQVVNDSMALLVSDELRQMILYSDAASVISRMKNMAGIAAEDSSLLRFAQKYTASGSGLPGESAVIRLQSRDLVYGSALPKETLEMQYDPVSKFPRQVVTIKRSLLPLDSLQYAALSGRPELPGQLLAPEAGRYFLIREKRQAFVYTVIEPNTQKKLPVLITDRIIRTAEGEYKPVQSYETYRLTLN